MLTLEEAVAEYKALWNRYTYTGDTPPENSPLINVVRREEVDAAVRDVALAAVDDLVQRRRAKGLPTQFALPDTKAEIDRLLGPEKAGA